ncbi:unnamed protein product [marine sediment metagenome]|uniref:Uncharacterized protein n=1 Tax=marine sediment metagenome TaxID=412755 RepID=X0XA27_9ZZZZ
MKPAPRKLHKLMPSFKNKISVSRNMAVEKRKRPIYINILKAG